MRPHPACKRKRSVTRRRGQAGSAAIEFAFTLVPLMAILMLMMDSAWAIFAQATLQEAAREGVRYAVTGQTGTGMCQDASIRSIVQQYAYGFISPSNAASQITIQYYLPTTLAAVSGAGSNAGGNIVKISISGVQVRSFGPIWRSNNAVNVAASAADVMEAPPNNIPPCR